MSTTQNYVLQSNQNSINRLQLQHRYYEQSSQRLLLDAGLRAGFQVLEIAAGPGLMTQWICDQVGPKGSLDANDINETYINIVKEKMQGYQNFSIEQLDIEQTKYFYRQYDLIYCRMVLHHLTNPQSVIHRLVQHLKPGGIIVCEEPPIMDQVFAYPTSQALLQLRQLVLKLFEQSNIDYLVAYKLPTIFKQLNLTINKQQVFQPLLDNEDFKLHLMGIEDISKKLIEKSLIDDERMNQLKTNLTHDLNLAEVVSLFKMIQIIATKK